MTAEGSPYRSRRDARPRERQLSFHHFRITLVLAGLVATLGLAAGCTTFPRQIRVHCVPEQGPALSCDSTVRAFWGIAERGRERVAFEPQLVPSWGLGAPPAGFASLDLDIQYATGRHRGDSRLVAQFAHGPRVALTGWHPTESGAGVIEALSAFERTLRQGTPAALEYRSGWGGLFSSIPLLFAGLLLLWVHTGRTRVVYRPDTGAVETTTRSQLLLRAQRRTLSRDEIVEAFAAATPGSKGVTIYLPALRLKTGETFLLGQLGSASPVRAEHVAGRINRLLESE